MNTRSTFPLLVILVLAAIVATTKPSSAIAPQKGPTASGEGQFRFNGELIEFSFDATANKHGNARGRAQFDNLSTQTHVEVKIKCLSAGSFIAVMTGTVLHSDDPDLPKSAEVVFAAFDGPVAWGVTAEDDITPLFLVPFPGADCDEASPLTILPISSGDIRVQP